MPEPTKPERNKPPFQPISLEEIKVKLDPSNKAFDELCAILNLISKGPGGNKSNFYRKDKNLPELFLELEKDGASPLVDKKLRLVICPTSHEWLKAILYCYHNNIESPPRSDNQLRSEYSDKYLDTGLGWYRSGMGGIVCSNSYKPDKAEKDTFTILGLEKFER